MHQAFVRLFVKARKEKPNDLTTRWWLTPLESLFVNLLKEVYIMLKTSFNWIVAVLALSLVFPMMASASEFHGTMSGTQFSTVYDSNDDGQLANSIEGVGNFTQLGKATAKGMNEMLGVTENPACSEYEIGLEQFYFHFILTAANGDMLFSEQYAIEACWNFMDATFWGIHHMQITGGTGRFAGATGYFDCNNAGVPLFNPEFEIVGYTWGGDCHGELNTGVKD